MVLFPKVLQQDSRSPPVVPSEQCLPQGKPTFPGALSPLWSSVGYAGVLPQECPFPNSTCQLSAQPLGPRKPTLTTAGILPLPLTFEASWPCLQPILYFHYLRVGTVASAGL